MIGLSPALVARNAVAHLHANGICATIHQLRHTFATEALRVARGNVPLVMGLMGHASPDTTMGYAGFDGGDAAPVVRRLYAV